jgi:arginyl-tRNA synthetase
MTPGELSSVIVAAARGAIAAGDLPVPDPAAGVLAPDAIPLRAARGGDGYATPLPLRLASAADRPPPEVAALLAKRVSRHPGVRTAVVTGPGMLTVSLRTPGVLAGAIVEAGERYVGSGSASVEVPPPSGPVWPRRPLTFDNPGFLVRFAHARAAATARYGDQLGIRRDPLDPALLDTAPERALLTLLGELPGWVRQAARADDPYVLARPLERVADAYHHVHEHCPALPKGDEEITARHHARLWLAGAVQLSLAGVLRTLGETPPERL